MILVYIFIAWMIYYMVAYDASVMDFFLYLQDLLGIKKSGFGKHMKQLKKAKQAKPKINNTRPKNSTKTVSELIDDECREPSGAFTVPKYKKSICGSKKRLDATMEKCKSKGFKAKYYDICNKHRPKSKSDSWSSFLPDWLAILIN